MLNLKTKRLFNNLICIKSNLNFTKKNLNSKKNYKIN